MDDLTTYAGERGPNGSREAIEDYVRTVIEQRTTVNDDTTAERLARGMVTSILARLGLKELADQEERRARDDERVKALGHVTAAIEERIGLVEELGMQGSSDFVAGLRSALAIVADYE